MKVEAFAFELQSHVFLLVLCKYRVYQSAAMMKGVSICEVLPGLKATCAFFCETCTSPHDLVPCVNLADYMGICFVTVGGVSPKH